MTTYNEGGEPYEVHVRAASADRDTAGTIGQLTVPSSRVGSVPLEHLAPLTPGSAPSEINRLNRQRPVTIFAGLLPGVSQTPAMAQISSAADSLRMRPGYTTRFAGRSRELGRAAQNVLPAFLLSLIFVYLILAAQFESWLHPVTILLLLPLALLSLIITRQSPNIFSALGLLVPFGVVKNNPTLQFDHANQWRERGMPRDEAIQASRDRLRAILMTTFAFVAGVIPLVLSSGVGSATNRAIGFAIIGGQSLVLVLTLVATSVAYSLFYDLSRIWRWRGSRAAAGTAGAVLAAFALWAPEAAAQQAAPAAPAVQAAPGDQILRLSRDEALRLAVANNPDLATERYSPEISAARAASARSVFIPTFQSSLVRNSQSLPSTSLFSGAQGQQTDFWSTNVGVTQLLPVGGGSYSVAWDSSRTTTNNLLSTFNPALNTQVQLAFSQPLWRDFRIDPLRAQVELADRNREIANVSLRERLVGTTASAERAYWSLVSAVALVDVQQRSLDLALELERTNRARVDVGQSPPLDLVAARAEVAQRRESLIIARTSARLAEDMLRTLIIDSRRDDFWSVRIDPADRVPPPGPAPDVDAAVRRALGERTDLLRVRQEIANADTTVALARNQTKPDVRVEANYLTGGVGGTRLLRTGEFPGKVISSESTRFGSALGQVLTLDYPTWNVGLTFRYPLGRSGAEADFARARIERDQAGSRLRSLELSAVREVREAAWRVEQNQQRIETARLARELAEQRVDAEQRRFEVGMSTSFLVIQAQRDLAVARNNELQAGLDYQLALVTFEAAQRAGGGGQAP